MAAKPITTRDVLQVARLISMSYRERPVLRRLAMQAGISPWRLLRAFTQATGESPAACARRLRVTIAATELLHTDASLQRVAQRSGYASIEVLIRNFRSEFKCTPAQYRSRHQRRARTVALPPVSLLKAVAPCIRLFHISDRSSRSLPMTLLSITLRTLQPQTALIIRSRIARGEIAATIGQSLGKIVTYALGAGGTLVGRPFARYPEYGPGLLTIEVGMPIATAMPGKDEIETFELPAGRCAIGLHGGSYSELHDSFTALERWIAGQGLSVAGPAWEVYVNDPADFPNAGDWRTEICIPVR